MKVLRYLFAICPVLFALASCEKPQVEAPVPAIKLANAQLTIESDGGSVRVAYVIENPVEGEKLTAESKADWLEVDASSARLLTISAQTNETGQVREGQIVLSYKGAEDATLTVSQDFFENPLSIEVLGVTATNVKFSVETSDPELTWIPMVTYKEGFEYYETPDELFASDIEYFEYLADINDMTLAQFIESMVATGSMEDVNLGGLQPSTDYVLYAYGVTKDARRTTDIVSCPFRTEDPYEGDISFTFEAEEEDYILNYSIIPSYTGVPYYYGVVTKKQWDMWSSKYSGDVSAAIQTEDIDATLADLMDLGMMSGPEDYFLLFSEADVMDFGYFELTADTEYVIFASRWDEQCQLTGPLSSYIHKSQPIDPSDNQLTLTLDNITQSSADATVTATNEDPYALINLRSSEIEGMADDEIFEFVTTKYDYILSEYTFSGTKTKNFGRMRPDTDYTFLAFGYKAGTMTTATMQKEAVKTLPAGKPEECTFEFEVVPDVDNAFVSVTPSDKGQFYFWLVYPSNYTADDVRSYIRLYIENWYENDFAAFASWELSLGDDAGTAWDLYANTEYKVGVVIMDYDTGEFLSDVHFSEPFTTPIKEYANIQFNWDFGPYYDLGELIRAGQKQFEPLLSQGNALMPLKVSLEGDYSNFYYILYPYELTDVEEYPDEMFYDQLQYEGLSRLSTNLIVKYDIPMTLVAVAYDNQNNPTQLYRQLLRFTQDGASPAKDFISSTGKKSLSVPASVMPAPVPAGSRKHEGTRMSSEQMAAKHQEAMTKVETLRKEKTIRRFEEARMRNSKHIAR